MDLKAKLDTLGLAQYASVLLENGFEDWHTVLDITEPDLDHLGFKRGHRRILQKEILASRRSAASPPADGPVVPEGRASGASDGLERKAKRRYRWHPRQDPNAPKKPKTAYVNFADHLRSDPSIAGRSFVDIAREVGRRWQGMESAQKQLWEKQAGHAMQQYEDQMDAYRMTQQYQDYQTYLETFKKAPGKLARQKIKPGSASSARSPLRSESPGRRSPSASPLSPSLSPANDETYEDVKTALDVARQAAQQLRQEMYGDEPLDLEDLPPEHVSRQALSALLDSNAILFYFNAPHAQRLLHTIYNSSTQPDVLAVAELYVWTAISEQTTSENGSLTHLTRRWVATACTILGRIQETEAIYLGLMRIYLGLAVFQISEKQSSARTFVTSALAIAKLMSSAMARDGSGEDWSRVVRTLVLLDCWLSQTLGIPSTPLSRHVHSVAYEEDLTTRTEDGVLQLQAVRIAYLSNEVSSVFRRQDGTAHEAIRTLANQLHLWQNELPFELRLSSILTAQTPGVTRSCHFARIILQITYLSAVIMLYGHPLVHAVDSEKVPAMGWQHCQATCVSAGDQIAKLFYLMDGDKPRATPSWLLFYGVCNASSLLLLSASQALRDRSTGDFDRLISQAGTCILSLKLCSSLETSVQSHADFSQQHIYEQLRRLRDSPRSELRSRNSSHKISINSLLASDTADKDGLNWEAVDEALPPIVRELTEILREPYGSSADTEASQPYPTPPGSGEKLFWFRT